MIDIKTCKINGLLTFIEIKVVFKNSIMNKFLVGVDLAHSLI